MGFFGRLAFWKRKDDLDDLGKDIGMDKDLGLDMNAGPSPELGMGLEPNQMQQPLQKYPSFQPSQSFQSSYQPPSMGTNDSYIASKNFEVISSKLDALRASLDSINQRLANIESIARGEQEEQRRKKYY